MVDLCWGQLASGELPSVSIKITDLGKPVWIGVHVQLCMVNAPVYDIASHTAAMARCKGFLSLSPSLCTLDNSV